MVKRCHEKYLFNNLKTNEIIGLVFIFILTLFFITGCGTQKTNFKNEQDVLKYLEREYKGETFEIVSHENITLSDERNCKDEMLNGDKYTVKSLETGITFTVKDLFYYNMIFCSPIKYDDYLNKSIENYSSDLDERIEITYANRAYAVPTLAVSISDFENEEEAMVKINNFALELSRKYPFSLGVKYVNFRICKGSLMSSKCNNITSIDAKNAEKIVELINGLKGV